MEKMRFRLLVSWLVLSLVFIFLIFLMTVSGPYSGDPAMIWDWFIPHVMPTLTLMLSGFLIPGNTAQSADTASRTRQIYWITVFLSAGYFAALFFVIAGSVFRLAGSAESAAAVIGPWLDVSKTPLSLFQALLAPLIAFYFAQNAREDGAAGEGSAS